MKSLTYVMSASASTRRASLEWRGACGWVVGGTTRGSAPCAAAMRFLGTCVMPAHPMAPAAAREWRGARCARDRGQARRRHPGDLVAQRDDPGLTPPPGGPCRGRGVETQVAATHVGDLGDAGAGVAQQAQHGVLAGIRAGALHDGVGRLDGKPLDLPRRRPRESDAHPGRAASARPAWPANERGAHSRTSAVAAQTPITVLSSPEGLPQALVSRQRSRFVLELPNLVCGP